MLKIPWFFNLFGFVWWILCEWRITHLSRNIVLLMRAWLYCTRVRVPLAQGQTLKFWHNNLDPRRARFLVFVLIYFYSQLAGKRQLRDVVDNFTQSWAQKSADFDKRIAHISKLGARAREFIPWKDLFKDASWVGEWRGDLKTLIDYNEI